MVDKEPRLTSKQIQADLQTQGTTMSARTIRRLLNEKGRYGRRPKRTPLLTQMQKKQDWSLPKRMWQNHNPSEKTYCGQMRQKQLLFGKKHHGTVYRKKRGLQRKVHSPYSQTWWRFKDDLGLLLALDVLTVWTVSWNLLITKSFWGATLWPLSKSCGLHHRSLVFQQDIDPKHTSKSTPKRVLKWVQIWIPQNTCGEICGPTFQ